jgi:HAD superfamily hydrolase (TIGR01509 family)
VAAPSEAGRIAAVAFDLDGVLVDSEAVWDEVRRRFTEENGGRWHEGAQPEMMGMSSVEWSRYVRDRLGVDMDPERISIEVADRVADLYRERLPLLPGAVESVRLLAKEWPLAVASLSNRHVIDLVVELAGLKEEFRATVSSEEVGSGKPAPDVYLEAARRLEVDPGACAAIEDSTNGIRSARAAGMTVIAVPNRDYPPEAETRGQADRILDSLVDLTPDLVRSLQRSH